MSETPVTIPLIEARGLKKTYMSGERPLTVIDGLDLAVSAGETVAIVGASGTGKSTLLHLLGGIDRPSAGEILFEGRQLDALSATALARYRNAAVGFVFQFHFLMPDFTALENVQMPLLLAGERGGPAARRAADLLADVGLADRGHHRPGELSGGEQQRVAIARAVARSPQLLLADEPTGNLDRGTGEAVFSILQRLNRERGLTMVVVTHNRELAVACGRTLTLDGGRFVPAAAAGL
ncbi:MAG: ABC transporter ATP-binding protein [Candidatus Methylomirabilia bacterium]